MLSFRKIQPKKAILSLVVVSLCFAADSTLFNNPSNINEAKFLGIGTDKTPLQCIRGRRNVMNQFTIFGIDVGKVWFTEEAC